MDASVGVDPLALPQRARRSRESKRRGTPSGGQHSHATQAEEPMPLDVESARAMATLALRPRGSVTATGSVASLAPASRPPRSKPLDDPDQLAAAAATAAALVAATQAKARDALSRARPPPQPLPLTPTPRTPAMPSSSQAATAVDAHAACSSQPQQPSCAVAPAPQRDADTPQSTSDQQPAQTVPQQAQSTPSSPDRTGATPVFAAAPAGTSALLCASPASVATLSSTNASPSLPLPPASANSHRHESRGLEHRIAATKPSPEKPTTSGPASVVVVAAAAAAAAAAVSSTPTKAQPVPVAAAAAAASLAIAGPCATKLPSAAAITAVTGDMEVVVRGALRGIRLPGMQEGAATQG